MKYTSFANPEVKNVFNAYPPKLRTKLMAIRQMIFDVAAETTVVGDLEETLKWRQPSYLTPKTKSGSTIRIDQIKSDEDRYAIYFHCQTTLVDTFKEMYGDTFCYEGNRAITFNLNDRIPEDALCGCIYMALTYHLDKIKSI